MHAYPVIKPDATWPKIAQRIRDLLELYGMSASQLGKLIGVGSSTISGWLVGRRRPTANNAFLLSMFGDLPERHYREEPRVNSERPRGTRLAEMRVAEYLRVHGKRRAANAGFVSGQMGSGVSGGVPRLDVDAGGQSKPSSSAKDSPPA